MGTLLKRIDREEHINRWYFVTVQATLLDTVAVVTAWGSRENEYQQIRALPMASWAEAEILAEQIVRAKLKRGYQFV
ncbi:MAG: WGR domain-containing protein [Chloroflexi bacterium]|nr:WGR domain-containing protein [Chloroflexota bacterium]